MTTSLDDQLQGDIETKRANVLAAQIKADPNTPGPDALSIGDVVFRSEECPGSLAIGIGEQVVSVQELIGGGRVVQAFGPQIRPVTWSGVFHAPFVDRRVATLRYYLAKGAEYLVTWRKERYRGIITRFATHFRHAWICDYEITLEITKDTNGAFSATSPPSIDQQVSALRQSANKANTALLVADPATSSFQPQIATLNKSLESAGPLAQATPSAAATVTSSCASAVGAVQSYLSTISKAAPGFLPANKLVSAITLISRNVRQGQAPTTIRVQGGSLYEIAAQYYGDIRTAFDLGKTNGIITPRIPSQRMTQVNLPPFGSSP